MTLSPRFHKNNIESKSEGCPGVVSEGPQRGFFRSPCVFRCLRIPAPSQPQMEIGAANAIPLRHLETQFMIKGAQTEPRKKCCGPSETTPGRPSEKESILHGREQPPIRVREKQSGDVLVHVRGIVGKLDVGH